MLHSSSLLNPLKSTPNTPSKSHQQKLNLIEANKLNLDDHKNCSRVEHVEHPSEEKFFEHCTNRAIVPRPLSRDHFCENLASLLFHSSAGERLQLDKSIDKIAEDQNQRLETIKENDTVKQQQASTPKPKKLIPFPLLC